MTAADTCTVPVRLYRESVCSHTSVTRGRSQAWHANSRKVATCSALLKASQPRLQFQLYHSSRCNLPPEASWLTILVSSRV